MSSRSRQRLAAFTGCALAVSMASAGVAAASSKPSARTLHKIGSSSKAARTQPHKGLGATVTQPLIAVSFVNGKATVIGGSAVSGSQTRAHVSNVPVSAVQCIVNFTTSKTRLGNGKTSARWFGGIGCSRAVELYGQAFLAESSTKFDGTGPFYTGELSSAKSGQSNTIINSSNPSLYVWSATNIFFGEKPARGVIVVLPSSNGATNSATTCKVVTNPSFGIGVHCDVYSNRF